MLVFPLLSISISLSLSPAQVCRSCSNPGTLPQSLLHRHSGYLRQRYGGTLQHIPLWPWLSVLRQEMFEWAVNESSWAVLSSLSLYIYIYKGVSACVCVDRSGCRLAHSTAGPLQTPLPQTPLSGQELQHQEQVLPVLIVTLYCSYVSVFMCVCGACVCVYGHEGACTTYASLDIRVCDFTSVLISGCRSSGESSPAAGNDSRQLIQPRLCVCLHAVCPQGSGWSPAEAGSAHTGGGLCEWETREMSAFIKRYCKMQS